jgi:hypothetical protein
VDWWEGCFCGPEASEVFGVAAPVARVHCSRSHAYTHFPLPPTYPLPAVHFDGPLHSFVPLSFFAPSRKPLFNTTPSTSTLIAVDDLISPSTPLGDVHSAT